MNLNIDKVQGNTIKSGCLKVWSGKGINVLILVVVITTTQTLLNLIKPKWIRIENTSIKYSEYKCATFVFFSKFTKDFVTVND